MKIAICIPGGTDSSEASVTDSVENGWESPVGYSERRLLSPCPACIFLAIYYADLGLVPGGSKGNRVLSLFSQPVINWQL